VHAPAHHQTNDRVHAAVEVHHTLAQPNNNVILIKHVVVVIVAVKLKEK